MVRTCSPSRVNLSVRLLSRALVHTKSLWSMNRPCTTLQFSSGPRALQLCTMLPSGSHSAITLRLDVHTCPLESAAIPMTWPHSKSAGRMGQSASAWNVGTASGGSVASGPAQAAPKRRRITAEPVASFLGAIIDHHSSLLGRTGLLTTRGMST